MPPEDADPVHPAKVDNWTKMLQRIKKAVKGDENGDKEVSEDGHADEEEWVVIDTDDAIVTDEANVARVKRVKAKSRNEVKGKRVRD